MSKSSFQNSSSDRPDLDWSQVRETVRMLQLSSGQIEWAMKDSDSSVDVLTHSFASIVDSIGEVSAVITQIPDQGESGKVRARLQGVTDHVSGMVSEVIVAFQFYDKLVQRLAHVNQSLAGLSELVSDQERLFSPEQWQALQTKILSKYSLPEEKAMFQAVLGGISVQQALEQFMAEMKNKSTDIDFF